MSKPDWMRQVDEEKKIREKVEQEDRRQKREQKDRESKIKQEVLQRIFRQWDRLVTGGIREIASQTLGKEKGWFRSGWFFDSSSTEGKWGIYREASRVKGYTGGGDGSDRDAVYEYSNFTLYMLEVTENRETTEYQFSAFNGTSLERFPLTENGLREAFQYLYRTRSNVSLRPDWGWE